MVKVKEFLLHLIDPYTTSVIRNSPGGNTRHNSWVVLSWTDREALISYIRSLENVIGLTELKHERYSILTDIYREYHGKKT